MNQKLTGYELSRAFWDFSFDNPEKMSPYHGALYFFIIEHSNRLGWKEKFGLPTMMTMEAIGTKTWRTYSKSLKDLADWGFIKVIEKSRNQYSSTIISLSATDLKSKALSKALQKHSQKHSNITVKSKAYIDKPNNLKPNNLEPAIVPDSNLLIFDSFRKKYPGTKRGNLTEFTDFNKNKSWRDILPILEIKLDQQILDRKQKELAKKFVPGWKNLKTWIHQKCWEEETALEDNSKDIQKKMNVLNKMSRM